MVELLRAHAPRVALRGSSMGGFQAIHAGARDPSICAVVAISPAPEAGLLRFLRSGQELEFRCDAEACVSWLESLDLTEGVAQLGPETALLLMHARGDEQVPYAVSEQLYEAAHEPKRLLLLPGGHHRSVQHDLELQAVVAQASSAMRRGGRVARRRKAELAQRGAFENRSTEADKAALPTVAVRVGRFPLRNGKKNRPTHA